MNCSNVVRARVANAVFVVATLVGACSSTPEAGEDEHKGEPHLSSLIRVISLTRFIPANGESFVVVEHRDDRRREEVRIDQPVSGTPWALEEVSESGATFRHVNAPTIPRVALQVPQSR